MAQEFEGSPEEIQAAVGQEGGEILSQLQVEIADSGIKESGLDERMVAYQEAMRAGRYSDPVSFEIKRSGESVPMEAKSVREYLQDLLKHDESMGGEESIMDEDQRPKYKERADRLRSLLAKMESLSGPA